MEKALREHIQVLKRAPSRLSRAREPRPRAFGKASTGARTPGEERQTGSLPVGTTRPSPRSGTGMDCDLDLRLKKMKVRRRGRCCALQSNAIPAAEQIGPDRCKSFV